MAMQDEAVFSECQRYRYRLTRELTTASLERMLEKMA